MIKAVVFDIDGTLTIPPLGSGWLELTKGLGGDPEKHLELYRKLSDGTLSLNEAKKKLLSMWGVRNPVSRERVRKIFSLVPLREGAKETIKYLWRKNYLLGLITGSPDTYAEVVAGKLGITEYFANDFSYDQDDNLIDFTYDPIQEEKKLKQLMTFLAVHSLKPTECAVVGDGWNDSKMFLHTGKGIALKSSKDSHFWDSRLENIAWKVIGKLPELRQVF